MAESTFSYIQSPSNNNIYIAEDSTKLSLNGGDLTGTLNMAGKDIIMGTESSQYDENGIIYFKNGSNNTKSYITMNSNPSVACGPKYLLASGIDYEGYLVPNYVKTGTITSWLSQYITGGKLVGYRFGNVITIQFDGITFKSNLGGGRTQMTTLAATFCPPAQMTSPIIKLNSRTINAYFVINADGKTYIDLPSRSNDVQLWQTMTYVTDADWF